MVKRGAKAAAIRLYRHDNPDAKPTDIIKALAKKNIKVSPNQVYSMMSEPVNQPSEKREPKPAGNGQPPHDTLRFAKALVMSAGSLDQARTALDTLAELQLT